MIHVRFTHSEHSFGGVRVFSGWGAGWGVKTFVALAHMVDATQHMGWGVGWGVTTSVALTQHMGWEVGWGCDHIRCTCTHG